MIQVSIVIVCMNNLKNLYPCLNNIRKYTSVSYETFVVAYLFSKDNLVKVKHDFPWVTFIESNEIRGFSENNNLALRQAKGKYCFVVNDDTEMKMPVIDKLVESFDKCPQNTAVVSPSILNYRGKVSVCGRPPITLKRYILKMFMLWNEQKDKHYINKPPFYGRKVFEFNKQVEKEAFDIRVSAEDMAELVRYVDGGKINITLAQMTLSQMLKVGGKVSDYISEADLAGISEGELEELCREAVAANPKAAEDYKSGKLKAIGGLFGYIKRATQGKADIKKAEEIIIRLLGNDK